MIQLAIFLCFFGLLALLCLGGVLWTVNRRLDEACERMEEPKPVEPLDDHFAT